MAGYGNRKRRGSVGRMRHKRKKFVKRIRRAVKRVQRGVVARRIGRRL